MPLFKLNVKSTILRFISTSMAKPVSLNIFIIFLRILSVCWPFTSSNMRRPSSLFRPQSSLLISFPKKHKMYIPAFSHTSGPSKRPIVISKQLSVCFFFHTSLLLNSKDLRQCFINLILSLDMSWLYFAKSKVLSRMFSVMDG